MELDQVKEVSLLNFYKCFVRKEKAIYAQLNKFCREGRIVYGYIWTPHAKDEFM
jgi:ABC-type proline/glycine betaine transport system substrate-binding protein